MKTGTMSCATPSIADMPASSVFAGIPGDAGGTPVQNVGAYGQEVAETILQVRAYDLEARNFVDLDHASCHFGYRRSLFNADARGRYIVTAVSYKLRPGGDPALRYADVKRHFAAALERGEKPTLRQVYDAVRSIREQKGMRAGQGGCPMAGVRAPSSRTL